MSPDDKVVKNANITSIYIAQR